MKLYEIDNAILECVDLETGEVLNIDRLQSLQMEKNKKIEGIACYYKQLQAESDAISNEIKKLKLRKEQKNKNITSLESYLVENLDGKRFETSKIKVSWRKSSEIKIIDKTLVPEKFVIKKTEMFFGKNELKKHIKSSGEDIAGVVLLEKNNIQIN